MVQKIYSIRDAKAECYNQPFIKFTHGEAERDFTSLINDNKSIVAQYPDDYDLYYLGEYNSATGVLTPLDTPHHIVKAATLVNKVRPLNS